MKKIKQYFREKFRLTKLKSAKSYAWELTVFIKVKIDNLNDFSKFIPERLIKEVSRKRDKIKINTVKKYLLISSKLKLILVNINLFIKTFLGLLKDKIWLIEYFNNE